MNEPSPLQNQSSRCIGVCTVNKSSICVDCHRSMSEISDWSRASKQEREGINRTAASREKDMPRDTA